MMRPLVFSAFVLLAGCARSEEAHYAQVDNNTLAAANALLDGEDDELAVGTWQTGFQGDQPVLEFGPVGAVSLFSIGCDERRNLLLQRPGAALSGDLPAMLVQVGSETRRLAVASVGTGIPMLRGTLASNDPFVRVLAGATTRIVVRVGDAEPLEMPSSPAIATYVQQCANGEARAAPVGNSAEAAGTVNVVADNMVAGNAANAR